MGNWYNNLDTFDQTLWLIAIPFSIFFALQSLLTLFGVMGGGADAADFDGDLDADDSSGDSDGGHFQVLSFKNFIMFFTIFGWTGIVMRSYGNGVLATVSVALIAGIASMLLFASITYFTSKLAESGNFNIQTLVDKTATVYLPIASNRSSSGKIQVQTSGTMKELEALTDDNESLSTGTMVSITEIINGNIVLVKKL